MIKNFFNQNNTEEEVHTHSVTAKLLPINRFWYLEFGKDVKNASNTHKAQFIIEDEALIKCFHLEVLTQPPNC